MIKAILEKGLKIPEDLSIVGFTDTIYAPFLSCPLATISHDVKGIGNEAFGLLQQAMQDRDSSSVKKVVIETQFYERKSLDKAP